MKKLIRLLIYFVIWLILTASFELFSLIVGLIVSATTIYLIDRFFVEEKKESDYNIFRLVMFPFYALYLIFKSSFDVVKLIIFNKTKVRYKKIDVSTKSMVNQNIIANTITLTPGTMTVSKENRRFGVYYLTKMNQDQDIFSDIKSMEERLEEK